MYQTVNFSQFVDAFHKCDRSNQFSYDGLKALYDWLEELGDPEGNELDVIAICCDFCEFEDLEAFQESYGSENYESIEDIHEQTTVIELPDGDGFIIQSF